MQWRVLNQYTCYFVLLYISQRFSFISDLVEVVKTLDMSETKDKLVTFLQKEYDLVLKIFNSNTIQVSIWKGIVMGGGVGRTFKK